MPSAAIVPSKIERPLAIKDVTLRKIPELWRCHFNLRRGERLVTHDRLGRLCYGPIFSTPANPTVRASLALLINRLTRASQFLDVGCGYGNIMLLAGVIKEKNHLLNIEGIEKNPRIAVAAAQYGTVHAMDAFRFQHYDKFDLIFTYRPMVDYRDQLELESRIIDAMAPGATFISALPSHHFLLGVNGRTRGIYTKPTKTPLARLP